MKSSMIAMAAVCSFCLTAAELFPTAFQRIGRIRKDAEAEKAYAELANKSRKPVQRNAAFHAAAQKAVKAKNFKNAATYIASISDTELRSFASMEMLFARRQFKQLIAESKDLKLEQWREDLIPEAAFMRAYSYAAVKNRSAAEKDMKTALNSVAVPAAKYRMGYRIANIYESFIHDNAAEIALIRSVLPYAEFQGVEHFYRQRMVCRYALLLGKTGKTDEGLKVLNGYRGDKAASRIFRIKQTTGDLYAMKGDKKNALKSYQEAQKIYPAWAKSLESRIKALK